MLALLLALLPSAFATVPCADLDFGIPASAPHFERSNLIGICPGKEGYEVPDHETIGKWTCFADEYCQSIGGYLGKDNINTCDDFTGIFRGNKYCDEWLNCAEYAFDGGDCTGAGASNQKKDATDPSVYESPVIEKPEVDPTCAAKDMGCLNVTVFIVDFGEDGITSGAGFVGLNTLRSLDEAIRIVSDPYCLDLGCDHEIKYRSDLFSTLHNYMIVYTSDNLHSMGSTAFEHGGASLTLSLSECGDDTVEEYEGCDDGNQINGDGCSAACLIEEGYTCITESGRSACSTSSSSTAQKEKIRTFYADGDLMTEDSYTHVDEFIHREIVVNNYDDTITGDCSSSSSTTCNVRAALLFAQTLRKVYPVIKVGGKTKLSKELPLIHKPMLVKGTSSDAGFDADNKNRVVTVSSQQLITLEGLTFENGKVKGFGALILNMGILKIEECKFKNSESVESGGMVWTASDKLWVLESVFEDGTAGSEGGAIENDGYVLLEGSTFRRCKAPEGAAVHNCADMDVKGCVFENNEAERDGGGMTSIGAFTMSDTTFKNNMAGTYGGGFYSGDTSVVTDCTFTRNTVSSTGNGGGLASTGSTDVYGCTFTENSVGGLDPTQLSEDDASDGEAQNGGGVYTRGSMILSESSFDGNAATQGGGVFNEGTLYVEGCTFGRNSPNKALYATGISYSSGQNIAGTAEIVFRGEDTNILAGDKPHANRVASCELPDACGTHAACEPKPAGKIGLTCTCPDTYPGGDPHSLCLSTSSGQISVSASRIQRTLVKPASEDFVIQFVKNGMGTKNTDIFTWTLTSTEESDWLQIAADTGSVSDKPFTSTTLKLSTVGIEAGTHTHTKTFTFDTDDDSTHSVTVELTVDNVADPAKSTITWSHEESVREDQVLVLEIQAYDQDGFMMLHGGDKFKLLKNLQSCVDTVCTTEGEQVEEIFVDNGDGTYTLEIIPDKTVDQYDMTMELNGAPTTFSDSARALKIETIDDTLEKVLVTVIVMGIIALAVGMYYWNLKRNNKNDIDFEKNLSIEEEKKYDLKIEQKLNFFWLSLDIFDVASDLASLIFAFMGDIGNLIVAYVFAAFVGLSLAVSCKVVITRLRCIANIISELKSDGNAKVFGTDVSLHNLQQSFRKSAKIAPAMEKAGNEVVMDLVMDYSRAVMNRNLFSWIIRLMCVEDIPSFCFNIYFIATAWPNLKGFTTPIVSIIITCISIGYKLSYMQKLAKQNRIKAQLERKLQETGLDKQTITELVKAAKKDIKAETNAARTEGKAM